jgi:hypothetical protein
MAPSPGIYLWQTEMRTIPLAEVGVMPGSTDVHILSRPEDVCALLADLDVESDDIERVLDSVPAQDLISLAELRALGLVST